jgi:aminoglycoside phosphotransferase (APT) family kinase protein
VADGSSAPAGAGPAAGVPAETAPVRAGEQLDWAALEAYLRAEIGGLSGPFSVLQFPNGSANLTYLVTVGATRLVVRRPPFGQLALGAHDMHREYRVLSRLGPAYPRAPRALAYCADPAVLGAHFLVSEYRPGVVIWGRLPVPMAALPGAGRRVGFAVVDALADLHAVRPDDCGLADLGRPDGYLSRQLAGWRKRWAAVAPAGGSGAGTGTGTVTGTVERVADLLAASQPRSGPAAIVHNDFKIDNCQFHPADPDRVISVFDWDMATLGDPLVDLGTLLNYWPDPADRPGSGLRVLPGLDTLGLPTRHEVVARYAQRRGLALADVRWYEAYGCWKTLIILQQLYARWQRGETGDPRMAARGEQVVALADRALRLLDG